MRKQKSSSGFTLVEILVVIVIIAVLSLIGLVSYTVVLKNGRDAKRQSDLRQIQSALEQYYSDQLFYPTDATLPTNGNAFTNAIGNPTTPATTKTYMNSTPKEAISGRNAYSYKAYKTSGAEACNNTTTKCAFYCIYADLEGAGGTIDARCDSASITPPANYDFGVSPP